MAKGNKWRSSLPPAAGAAPEGPAVLVVYACPGYGEFGATSLTGACDKIAELYPMATVGQVWWPRRLLPPAWLPLLGEGHGRPEYNGWRPVLSPKAGGGTEMVAVLIGRDSGV